MGTRCTTRFYEDKKFICSVYRQYDGYLDGHGQELKELLKNKILINGICGETTDEAFNGMRCLAAYVIGKLKGDSIGHIYMSTEDDVEQYDYVIYNGKKNHIGITATSSYGKHIIYDGDINDFLLTEDEILKEKVELLEKSIGG